MHRIRVWLAAMASHHITFIEVILVLVVTIIGSAGQVEALPRLLDRSVFLHSALPGVTTDYDLSFTFRTAPAVGSVDLLFCMNPIPYMPCVAPAGIDVSQAVLASQSGETGWTITQRSANHLLLSRPPAPVGETPTKLMFTGIRNPTITTDAFSIRMADYASSDATGAVINPGSVRAQVTNAIVLQTQVPPILIFCLAEQVTADCTNMSDNRYTDMGNLLPTKTLTAISQMGVGTNASQGYSIAVYGNTMQAGTNTITPLTTPTESQLGKPQFGLNLVANTVPEVGIDPDGASENATASPDYAIPNKFMFKDGDVVAGAPNVSLIRRFTTSYIVNSPETLRPGVYTTTMTFICSGRF